MGTQRNYLINTTTIATAASGTTIASGNTQDAAFVVARTLVRTGIGAGEFASGSQTWAVHYVVSAMVTPYNMRLKVQRRNSSGTMQAESGYGTTRSATGTYDDNLTADLGTWAANDQLALVWEHFRPSGTGNKSATIDANGSSYIDAPTSTTPLTQDITGESINNLADAHVEVLGLRIALTDDANLLTDYFVYGKRPRWQDSLAKTVDAANGITLTLSDNINNLADAYAQRANGLLPITDALPAFGETFWYSNKSRWQDSLTKQLASSILTLSLAESINNLADAYSQIEGQRLTFSDNANNLTDTHSLIEGQLVPCSDSANNLTDAFSQIEEQRLTFSDPANNLADAYLQIEGQLKTFADDANNLNDAATKIEGHLLSFSDSVNNLSDLASLRLEQRIIIAESVNNLADVLAMIEGERLNLSESINNLADEASLDLVSTVRTVSASDDLNNWADSASRLLEYRLTFAESVNNLADALVQVEAIRLTVSDSLPSLAEALSLLAGENVASGDTLALSDSYAQILEYRLTLAENANNLADAISKLGTLPVAAADLMSQSDACSVNESYLVPCSDSIFLSDSVATFGAGFLPLDDFFTLDDSFQAVLGASGGQLLVDSFTLTDAFQFSLDLPITANDTLNNWQDGVSMYLPRSGSSVKVPADSRRVIV